MLPNRCKIVKRKRYNFHKIVGLHLVALQNFCFRFEHLLFRACVCSKVGSGNGTMGIKNTVTDNSSLRKCQS
jgi:hypothetical protein